MTESLKEHIKSFLKFLALAGAATAAQCVFFYLAFTEWWPDPYFRIRTVIDGVSQIYHPMGRVACTLTIGWLLLGVAFYWLLFLIGAIVQHKRPGFSPAILRRCFLYIFWIGFGLLSVCFIQCIVTSRASIAELKRTMPPISDESHISVAEINELMRMQKQKE